MGRRTVTPNLLSQCCGVPLHDTDGHEDELFGHDGVLTLHIHQDQLNILMSEGCHHQERRDELTADGGIDGDATSPQPTTRVQREGQMIELPGKLYLTLQGLQQILHGSLCDAWTPTQGE